jgi:homoaconitase/3-isopropylmalate dehydratase large subunit
MTVRNMTIEGGARARMIAPDEIFAISGGICATEKNFRSDRKMEAAHHRRWRNSI